MEMLLTYRWPGNVRELRTAIEHAVVLSRSEKIAVRDLPAWVRSPAPETKAAGNEAVKNTLSVAEGEKQLISRALQECQGNRSEAARRLGISRRNLYRKLEHYQLKHL